MTDSPYTIGQPVLIRTVTYAQAGVITEVHPHEIVLIDASWVADTGRFGAAVAAGGDAFSEVELFPAGTRVIVGRGAIVDVTEIPSVPTKTK